MGSFTFLTFYCSSCLIAIFPQAAFVVQAAFALRKFHKGLNSHFGRKTLPNTNQHLPDLTVPLGGSATCDLLVAGHWSTFEPFLFSVQDETITHQQQKICNVQKQTYSMEWKSLSQIFLFGGGSLLSIPTKWQKQFLEGFLFTVYIKSPIFGLFSVNFLVVDSHFSFQALCHFLPYRRGHFFLCHFSGDDFFSHVIFPIGKGLFFKQFLLDKNIKKNTAIQILFRFLCRKNHPTKHHFAYKKMIFQKHPTNPGNKRFHGTGWKIFSVMVVRKIKSDGSAKNCDFLLTRFFPMVKKDSLLPTIRF